MVLFGFWCQRRQAVGDFRHQIGQTVAVFGRDTDGIAEAEGIGVENCRGRRASLGLVSDQQYGFALATQPLCKVLVGWRDAGSGVQHEQHEVGLRDRVGRSGTHAAGKGFGRGFL